MRFLLRFVLRIFLNFLRTFSGALSPCKPRRYWLCAGGQHDRFCDRFCDRFAHFFAQFLGGCHDGLKLSCLPEAAIQPLYWSAGEKSVYRRVSEC
ncbi:hypothetical protein, partial [Escherichia coli]|uniref:hypothetical protein n=1 Tax=Escherichia coli TaxID=562 RepID=UPI002FC9B6C4